ncbi:MAG: hypothetical protein OER12_05045 [Acidimicrobiia bacterium]|nr:hypothetical protein [Acidimicrobiia bacterium]
MKTRTPARDYFVVVAVWTMLVIAFWTAQEALLWTILFPLIAFLWMGLPLLLTRFDHRPLVAISATMLLVAASMYLTMVWGAIVILGWVGWIAFELEELDSDGVARRLLLEGLKFVPGAAAGAVAGVTLRSQGIRIPVE